jgi:prolyl-tRNA editing enzyme YbaK/EbsC (Cys-tRNA(Pro) deacylase)
VATARFQIAAEALGLQVEIRRFPEGTKTAEAAARAVGCDLAQIVKSLVFMADGRPLLALTSGSNRADPMRLAAIVGAKEVRRATPDEAREATGFAIGGTPPFGHPTRLRVLVDPDLMAHDEVWAAAGTSDSVFLIAPASLVEAAGGEIVEFKESGGSSDARV